MLTIPTVRQNTSAVSESGAHSQLNMNTTSFPQENQFMSLQEVAAFLAVSPVTVYRLVDRSLLTVYRVARRLRFTRRDVLRFLEHQRTDARYARPKN